MTAPTKAPRAAAPLPPGLAAHLRRLDEYDGPDQLDAHEAAHLLQVTSKTVVGWATSRQLSAVLLPGRAGYRFTIPDLRDFLVKRYQRAR